MIKIYFRLQVHLQKMWNWLKGDYKKTRRDFVMTVSFVGLMIVNGFSIWSLIVEPKTSLKDTAIIVNFWQLCYTFVWLMWLSTTNQLAVWREKTNEIMAQWGETIVDLNKKQIVLRQIIGSLNDYPQTYLLVEKDKQEGILCLDCFRTSFHPTDIEKKYCAGCKKVHEPRRK